jgi:hypothetical protein
MTTAGFSVVLMTFSWFHVLLRLVSLYDETSLNAR